MLKARKACKQEIKWYNSLMLDGKERKEKKGKNYD